MRWLLVWLACPIILTGLLVTVSTAQCPENTDNLKRLGQTMYFIVQNVKTRGPFVNHSSSEAECRKYGTNMKLATINSVLTHAVISRELEHLANEYHLEDTWYWINAVYNYEMDCYVLKNDKNQLECMRYSGFLYRHPRPSGIGAHISAYGHYNKDKHVPQCLAIALPWPGVGKQNKTKKFYGHQTSLDERACESVKSRHVLCENPDCKMKDDKDMYVLTDDASKLPYFNSGNYIFGDRKYIVNWQQRTKQQSEEYCRQINLTLFEPSVDDRHLIPFLKMWTRTVTISHFWSNYTYDLDSRQFFNTKGVPVVLKNMEFKEAPANSKGATRSTISKGNLCVGMSHLYELKDQAPPCPVGSKSCDWSFIRYIPANCKSHFATICQHEDRDTRKIEFKSSYINNIDLALKETAFVPFKFPHSKVLRSTYKQTFGSLYCPDGYELFTKQRGGTHTYSNRENEKTYDYDLLEEYWVLDKAYDFPNQENETCSYFIPERPPIIKRAPCTNWKFYLCFGTKHNGKYPNISATVPKYMWNAEPQRRVFPIYTDRQTSVQVPISDTCTFKPQELRIQMLFLLSTHESMRGLYSQMKNILPRIGEHVMQNAEKSEFGLAYFSQWRYNKSAGEQYTNKCYMPAQKFTADINKVVEEIGNIPFTKKETYYSIIPSMSAFAFTDENLSWNRANFDDEGRRIIRVLLAFQGYKSLAPIDYQQEVLHNFGDRIGFTGDGSDTCERNRVISTYEYENIFRKNFACNLIYHRVTKTHRDNAGPGITVTLNDQFAYEEGKHGIENLEEILPKMFRNCLKCFSLYPVGYNTLGL